MNKFIAATALSCAMVSLSACSLNGAKAQESSAEQVSAQLMGDEWVVEEISGQGVVDASRATLQFGADGRLSGNASCNQYGTQFSLEGDRLVLGPIVATRRACAMDLMDQEKLFFEVMNSAGQVKFGPGGVLTITAENGLFLTARR